MSKKILADFENFGGANQRFVDAMDLIAPRSLLNTFGRIYDTPSVLKYFIFVMRNQFAYVDCCVASS